jgi:hypothetical protein
LATHILDSVRPETLKYALTIDAADFSLTAFAPPLTLLDSFVACTFLGWASTWPHDLEGKASKILVPALLDEHGAAALLRVKRSTVREKRIRGRIGMAGILACSGSHEMGFAPLR